MNILRPKFIIIIALLLLILATIAFLKFKSFKQQGAKDSSSIPVYQRISPKPFPSTPYEQLPSEEKLKLQTEADINYSELQNKILNEFPWYNDLPLQESNYFVFFDLGNKTFKGKIYPQKSSAILVDDQVNAYKQEILGKLKQLNIDTTLYKVDWIIIPE